MTGTHGLPASPRGFRLRSDAIALRTAAGVVVTSGARTVELKGGGIAQRLATMLPRLAAGVASLSELYEDQPASRGIVERLCAELASREMLEAVDPADLQQSDLRPYAPIDRYFDHLAGPRSSRVRQMRESSIAVVGSGLVAAAAAHALIELGAGHLAVDRTQRHHDRIALYQRDARDRGKATRITFVDLARLVADSDVSTAYRGVILAADPYEPLEAATVALWCRGRGVTFAAGGRRGRWGLVAPVSASGSDACALCAWTDVAPTVGPSSADSRAVIELAPAAAALLGNELALEIFKGLTGVVETRPHWRTFLLDLDTLTVSLIQHDVAACAQAAHRQPTAVAHTW